MTTSYLACGDVLPGGPTTSSDSPGEGLLRQAPATPPRRTASSRSLPRWPGR